MKRRITVEVVLFLGVFTLPLWLFCPAALIFLFVFENFYEIIILGIILDALYGIPTRYFAVPALYTLSAGALFIARNLLKKHLKFYV